jgi:hypothetical protein
MCGVALGAGREGRAPPVQIKEEGTTKAWVAGEGDIHGKGGGQGKVRGGSRDFGLAA